MNVSKRLHDLIRKKVDNLFVNLFTYLFNGCFAGTEFRLPINDDGVDVLPPF